jgi:oligoendopeptidase F
MESHLHSFRPAFDDFLATSGDTDIADLAGRFDLDIRREQFRESSLDMIRRDIDTFVDLADLRLGLAPPQV